MNGIDWSLLRSFLAVVETGSLSAASMKLAASQPTLSRQIRDLESALGVTLFARSVRGLDPTDAALALIDDARAMGAAAQALALRAEGRSQELTGTVRIAASVIVANLMLPPILVALRDTEPNIQIEIVASDLTQNLLRRDADIAVRMVDPTQNALIARKLGEAPIGLFGAKAYFDRRGRIATIDDLASHDIIGFDRSDSIIKSLSDHQRLMTRNDFPVRSDDQMVYWNLLLAGAGVGFAQALVAGSNPALEQVEIGLRIASMPVWLVMHAEVRTNARIRRVADFIATELSYLLRNTSSPVRE